MKKSITKFLFVFMLIVSITIPSSVFAYTQADIDSMFATVQSLLQQVSYLIANQNNLAQISGDCSITSFNSSAGTTVTSGTAITLSWTTSGVCPIGSLTGGQYNGADLQTSGQKTTNPIYTTTTYTITFGTTSKSLTINIASAPVSPKFQIGDTVYVTSNLNVRSSAGGTIIGTQSTGVLGTIVGGPISTVTTETTTWWNVDFASGVDGWSYEGLLAKSTNQPAPTPVPTVTLSASPTGITSGQSATLTWSSTNATSCSASNGWSGAKTISGSEAVTPTTNTTYTLTCTGSGGSSSQSATVSVTTAEAPVTTIPDLTITVAPTAISSGQSATLTWSGTNVTSCLASGGWSGEKQVSGSELVSPTTNSTYTLTCTGASGSVSKSLTVSVAIAPTPVPTVTLSASPTGITSGQSATLTWSSTNATSCSASNGWSGAKTISGSEAVTPTTNTTYTLTCTGSGGSSSQSATVSVSSITVPISIDKFVVGDSVQTTDRLNVRSSAGGSVIGKQAAGAKGTVVGGPVKTSKAGAETWWNIDYSSAPDGWGAESFLIKTTTTPPPPAPTPVPTVTLSASPTGITSGQSATLTWSSTNATSCSASNGWSGAKTISGSEAVTPTTNTTYTLTCTGSGGSSSQSATVSVTTVPPPPTSSKFQIGDSVYTTANLNVRSSANGTIIGTQSAGAQGTIIGGPITTVTSETLTWWNVDYINAPDGWSYEGFLEKSTTPPPSSQPTVTISANPTSISSGQSATLTWSSTNATSCSASNGWSGAKTISGTQIVSPTISTIYTLTCTGNGGSASQSVTVSIGGAPAPALPTVSFSASPASITSGQSATLTWSSTNATSCSASNGWSGAKTTSGSQSVTPTTNTTYTLTCTGSGGSVSKNVNVSVGISGPITLPQQPLIFQVPMPTQTGKTWTVAAGDSAGFQSALNQSQLGDVIELAAGSTYTGNFTFPKKSAGSGWIVVRSNKYSSLPNSSVRVQPSDAINMPKIVSTITGATITFAPGSHHYRLIGLDVSNAITNTSYVQNAMVSISPNSGVLADLPNNITLDRMYIHSQPTTQVQRCVHTDGSYIAIVDSYLGDCHAKGYDSQAIAMWNTNGPIKIVNNMLQGAGENILFGGADPLIQGAIPSDIEIRNNYVYTPASWGASMSPTPWTKKNLIETKAARRVLIEGNVFDGSWADGQVGNAFVIKSSNQGGKCTWCQTTDVTVRYNVVRNIGGGGGVSGNSGANNNPLGGLTSRVLFEHNIFENINVYPYMGVARLLELYNNAQDVIYRNNTFNTTGYIQHYITGVSGTTATNFEYRDNIAPFGQYGIVPGYSESSLDAAVSGTFNYSGDVIYGGKPTQSNYPNTKFVADYNTALLQGTGADQTAVLAATRYAVNGNGTAGQLPPVSSAKASFAVANNPAVLGQSTTGLMFARTLVKGIHGDDVQTLQQFLAKAGFFNEEPTGYFGTVTEQAVQKFQIQYGIVSSGTPDTTGFGIVGPKTQQKIVELSE